jgi:hypothetical protein
MRKWKWWKWLLALGLLAGLARPASSTVTQIVGTLVDAAGNPIANGTACFRLPVNAIDTSLNRALSPSPVCFPVTNGTFPAFANLTPNDVISPAGTYYQATVRNSSGALVFSANYVIPTGAGTFNIGLAVPTLVTTSNISYFSPGGLGVSNTWTAANNFLGAVTLGGTVSGPVVQASSCVNIANNGSCPAFTSVNNPKVIFADILLAAGSSTLGGLPFTGVTTFRCGASNATGASTIKIAYNSGAQITVTGTGTDTISIVCIGN